MLHRTLHPQVHVNGCKKIKILANQEHDMGYGALSLFLFLWKLGYITVRCLFLFLFLLHGAIVYRLIVLLSFGFFVQSSGTHSLLS